MLSDSGKVIGVEYEKISVLITSNIEKESFIYPNKDDSNDVVVELNKAIDESNNKIYEGSDNEIVNDELDNNSVKDENDENDESFYNNLLFALIVVIILLVFAFIVVIFKYVKSKNKK